MSSGADAGRRDDVSQPKRRCQLHESEFPSVPRFPATFKCWVTSRAFGPSMPAPSQALPRSLLPVALRDQRTGVLRFDPEVEQ